MANAGVAKGSTVEVSSEEPGFHGAWYVATLLDDQLTRSTGKTKSSSNKKHKHKEVKYLVRYDTLLKDDSLDEPLTEIVNPTCVRPLPPRNLRRNNVNYAMVDGTGGDEFEVYDVVDAYHREGWWIGVVNKVVNVAGNRKYVVSFENPPEEVEFGRSQLRLHADWVDGRWQFPPKKTPEDKLAERNAKRASEADNDARAGFTTPSKGARTTDGDSANASPQPSSVVKTRSRKTTEKSSETVVGAVKESDSSRRNRGNRGNVKDKASVVEKRGSNDVHEDSPVTEPETKKTTPTPDVDIPVVAPQRSSVVKSRSRKNSERSSEAVVKASDPSPGSKGSTKAKKSKSDAVHQDSPLMEHEANQTTTETCEAEDSQSSQKKRKANPPKLLAKEPISSQQGGPEITVDLDDPTLSQLAGVKRRFSSRPNHNDEQPSQPTHTNPGPEPDHQNEPPSQSTVTNPGPDPDDYQQSWPFTKMSPMWATIAALEFYQRPQQRPHFAPLKKIKADHREGLAIAHVVTFGNLVETLSTLQMTDPVDVINNSLEILTDLETHGFNVGAFRSRLNKLLSLKSKASQHTIKLKKMEEELEKCIGEKCVVEAEVREAEMKIKELWEKLAQKLTMKKVRDEEMMGLQSNMKFASEQISDCELAFWKLTSTPL